MPLNLLFSIENPDKALPSYITAGRDIPDYIHVHYNSDTGAITYSYDPLSVYYTGPRIGEVSDFQFCDYDVLNQFSIISSKPYAARSQYANSAACTISTTCDAYIQNPVLTTPANLEAGGTAIIRGYTTKPNLFFPAFPPIVPNDILIPTRFSLDGVTYQDSPVFTNLPAGFYTAYMVDSSNCTATREFEIVAEPVYGVRFTTTYKDYLGNTTRIDISKRGYTGEAEEVRASDTPLVIKERADGLFSEIRAQECVVSLIATKEYHYLDLLTSDDREYRVEVYKNDLIKWLGWVLPDFYQEPYLAPPFAVSFSASDGLGGLKEIPFTDGLPEGTLTQWEVFMHIIKRTDLRLPVSSGLNLYETRMNRSEVDEPLKQAIVSLDAYHDGKTVWDCAEVLTAILRSYGAFLRQHNGAWQICRVEEFKSSFIRRNYTSAGEFLSYELIYPNKLITGPHTDAFPERLHWIDRGQYLEFKPAYKQAEVLLDYKNKTNILPGGDLKKEDFTPVFDANDILIGYQHRHFEGLLVQMPLTDPDEEKTVLQITQVLGPITNAYIQGERVYVYPDKGTGVEIKFEYRVTGAADGVTSNPPLMIYSLRLNDDLYLNPTGYINQSPIFKPGYHQIEVATPNFNSWQTYSFTTYNIPEEGWLTLRLHKVEPNGNGYVSGLEFRRIAIIPVVSYVEKDKNYKTISPKRGSIKPEPLDAMHGDVPPIKNAPSLYRNLIMVNGIATVSQDWQRRGKSEAEPLLKLLSESILSLNETPVKVIRGTLKGAFAWDQVIQEAEVLTRYMPIGFEYNDKDNTISSEFMELLGTTQPRPEKRLLWEDGLAILNEDGTYIELEG